MLQKNINSFLHYVSSANKVQGLLFTWNSVTNQLELIPRSNLHSCLRIKSYFHTFYVTILALQLLIYSFPSDEYHGNGYFSYYFTSCRSNTDGDDGTLGLMGFFTGIQIYQSYVLHVMQRLAPDIVTFVNGHLWSLQRFSLGTQITHFKVHISLIYLLYY